MGIKWDYIPCETHTSIHNAHTHIQTHTLRVANTHTLTHTHTLKWGGGGRKNNNILPAHKIILRYHRFKKKVKSGHHSLQSVSCSIAPSEICVLAALLKSWVSPISSLLHLQFWWRHSSFSPSSSTGANFPRFARPTFQNTCWVFGRSTVPQASAVFYHRNNDR